MKIYTLDILAYYTIIQLYQQSKYIYQIILRCENMLENIFVVYQTYELEQFSIENIF